MPTKTKPTITPIVSYGCCHRIQLDLMDMRLSPAGDYKWILQIKCHFSRYVWLTALKDKESTSTAAVFSTWLDFNGFCKIVQCDNGTEFKGVLRRKCLKYGIKIINGRAYHPETQGSVERANGTYKQRLRAYIMETGGNNWVESLGDITRVINTTPCSVLPRHTTPYEVFFGRKPRFGSYNPLQSSEGDDDDDDDIYLRPASSEWLTTL